MSRPRPPRNCKACGKLLVRRPGESYGGWSERKCCDRICGGRMNQKFDRNVRVSCSGCGKTVACPPNRQFTKFMRQKFCSQECAYKSRINTFEMESVNLLTPELAMLAGVEEVTIHARRARKLDLLTGERG